MRHFTDDRDVVIHQGGGTHRRGVGGRLALPLLCFAVGMFGLVLVIAQLRASLDPIERDRAREAYYAQIDQAQRLQWVYDVQQAALALLPVALLTAAGVVALYVVYQRWARPGVVMAQLQVEAIKARYQVPTPHTLNYAPHYPASRQEAPALPPALDALAAPAADVPTFAELLDRGKVGKGNPLMLGTDLDTGDPLSGSWLDLYSTAIGGLPGTGKTTGQRFLACQTALHGAGFVIVDPHAGAGEDSLAETLDPLRPAFLCDPASTDKAILQAVRLVGDIGHKRVHGDKDRRPVILWLDETTALLSRSTVADALAELIEQIAQEYRKVGVFCAASGQIWSANRTGDSSALRDSFASVLAFRMKRSQARMLLPTEEARDAERLERGTAILWRTSGQTNTIAIPNTTAADVRRVAGLLTADAPTIEVASYQPERSQNVAVEVVATSAPASPKAASPEAARAAGLFLGGMVKPADLVRELRGVKSSEGARYQAALAEVMELVRQGVQAER